MIRRSRRRRWRARPAPELILTYFANELRDGTNTHPLLDGDGGQPRRWSRRGMGDDQILINQWLADDLRAKPGDEVELTYFIPGTTKRMEEKRDRFRVYAVAPMEGPAADRSLLPDFPGIAKAESTANWDAGFPIDLGKIRPKDEQYWKDYRGTPKAFVTLKAGQRMWGNRFGDLTAVRWPGETGAGSMAAAEQEILSKLTPASVGLSFLPVREQALAAAASGQAEEFGGLFLSFSFFLIAAALILLALLFRTGDGKAGEGDWDSAGAGMAAGAGAAAAAGRGPGGGGAGRVAGRGGRGFVRARNFVGVDDVVERGGGEFRAALSCDSGHAGGRRRGEPSSSARR